MKEWAKQFYSSQAWKKCRDEYAKSKGRLCERCLEKGLYKPGEIVHHKVMLTPQNIVDGSVTLDFDNLQLLCRDCHAFVHKGYEPRYKVDELGRITAWDD